ncbi:hypothetical protein Goari_024248 [Gossypium aridum]|uniref:Uncharacterized protein n=1 Tax=Gossypium aridum TaxID=34290 RepID=A0A7J8X5L6_GOSAI|nr:hypothetical protein [Gossypium aridum]
MECPLLNSLIVSMHSLKKVCQRR